MMLTPRGTWMVPHKMSLHVLQMQFELAVKSQGQPQQVPLKLEE